jgi:hypothetical protein
MVHVKLLEPSWRWMKILDSVCPPGPHEFYIKIAGICMRLMASFHDPLKYSRSPGT